MECIWCKLSGRIFMMALLGAIMLCCGMFGAGFSARLACAQNVLDNKGGVAISSDDIKSGESEAHISGVVPQKDGKTARFMEAIRKSWDSSIDGMSSLFFTYWQHQSIITAKKSHGVSRPTTEAELKRELERLENLELDPERRYVSLGGIVYKGENDWTIWINGERVTPGALPPQALDLRVYKDYIELKWLDGYTNSVFPLRLRAHQRFNLDQRIFLPG